MLTLLIGFVVGLVVGGLAVAGTSAFPTFGSYFSAVKAKVTGWFK